MEPRCMLWRHEIAKLLAKIRGITTAFVLLSKSTGSEQTREDTSNKLAWVRISYPIMGRLERYRYRIVVHNDVHDNKLSIFDERLDRRSKSARHGVVRFLVYFEGSDWVPLSILLLFHTVTQRCALCKDSCSN